MTKFIVNNSADALKTDINLFFTIINCRIARACSLTRRTNFKFMCLSAYWPQKLANERAWISAVIVKSVVVVRTRPRAIPLAMITMRKSTHGFPLLSRDKYGAPLGGPSGRRSSAITNECVWSEKSFELVGAPEASTPPSPIFSSVCTLNQRFRFVN